MAEVIEALLEEVRSLRKMVERGEGRPLLMDTKRAAFELSLGETVLKKMIRTGEIASIKKGRRRLISAVELERWISSNTAAPSTRVLKTRGKTEGDKIRAALKKR